MDYDMTENSLRKIPLFSDVSDDDLDSIASHLIERRYPKGSTIVEEGLPGDYMYVLKEGRVKVTRLSEDGREKILEMLGESSFFGEMALLDQGPRSATVKTLTPVVLLALSRTDFLGLLRRSPDLSMIVIQELTRRLRDTDEQASSLSFLRVKDRTTGLLRRMADTDIRHMPVIAEGRLLGLVARRDALEFLYDGDILELEQLRSFVFRSGARY